jgi:hypothetical protein
LKAYPLMTQGLVPDRRGVAAHGEADALVGQLLDGLRGGSRWHETIVAPISEHCQLTRDLDAPLIDVAGALSRAGLKGEVIVDGSAVLIRAHDTDGPSRVLGALEGVAGVVPFAPGVLYAHAKPGRVSRAAWGREVLGSGRDLACVRLPSS